jgi:ATP-dependent Zn protease
VGHERLGPLTFGKKEEQIFLGREISQHRDYSEETAIKIDAEVRRFIDDVLQVVSAQICMYVPPSNVVAPLSRS